MSATPRPPRLDEGPALARTARGLLRFLWLGAVPALLAIVSVRYLIPSIADVGLSRMGELFARLGAEHPIEIGAMFFVLYAVLVRAWRLKLPGGRYLSALPIELVPRVVDEDVAEYEEAAEQHRILSRALHKHARLSGEKRTELEKRLGELAEAIASGPASRLLAAREGLAEAGAELTARHQRAEGISIALGIVGAALIALTLKGSFLGVYRVLSGSMLPTLKPGDHLAVNKMSYGFRSSFGEPRVLSHFPRRGDLVVFSRDDGDGLQEQVKRVVGLPGDHITMEDALVPTINGWTPPTCIAGQYTYVSAGSYATGRVQVEFLEDRAYLVLFGATVPKLEREYVVAPGEVFVLGDNRSDSMDSRSYNAGFGGGVDIATIEGRVDWFLSERGNNGDVDLKRLFSRHGPDFSLDGVDASDLKARIRECLSRKPSDTHPPAPPGAAKGTAWR